MKHLEERVSELVDDRLDHDERDEALAHLTVCEQCRTAVEYERTAKSALRSLPDVEPSDRLMSALLGLSGPGGPLPAERPGLAKSAPVAGWRESGDAGAKRTGRRPGFTVRSARLATAGVLSAGGVVALLTAVGAPADQVGDVAQVPGGVNVVPSADEFLLEHARTTGGLPFAEPVSYLMPMPSARDEAR